MDRNALTSRLSALLLIVGPLTSLAISPFSSLDPINLVKLLIVSSFAGAILFMLIPNGKKNLNAIPSGLWIGVSTFIFWMVLVFLVSDAPINQQFWGVFGRNNGLLSYFSLSVILVAVALIQQESFYRKLVDMLVLTSVPMTLYALIQVAGQDPISWSVMAPFATLGNINFSSAFFGLASLCATILAFDHKQNAVIRLALIVLTVTDLWIILETGSIQGFMIYLAGVGIAGYFLVRSISRIRILQIPYLVLGFVGFALTALALQNIGPLARFVFGETILFRFDYWYAGWAMTVNHPFSGVGLDSYGDWYRELRGEVATLRTVPDRITNTAHNIYLDISASGGFPLIIAYFVMLGYAARAAFRVIQRTHNFNPYFVALFSTWVAYLIQAAISINQIGVGIWGWLFTGALVGYEIATRESSSSARPKSSKGISPQLSASAALLGIVGFAVGFFLSFIPYKADQNFKIALQSGDAKKQFEQSQSLGSTAYYMELALDAAIKSSDERLASEIADELIKRYPRDFMAWRVKQALASATAQERSEALEKLKALDPYNPEIRPID